jgi:hypothetical protein
MAGFERRLSETLRSVLAPVTSAGLYDNYLALSSRTAGWQAERGFEDPPENGEDSAI